MISNFTSTPAGKDKHFFTQPHISRIKGTAPNLLTLEQAGLTW